MKQCPHCNNDLGVHARFCPHCMAILVEKELIFPQKSLPKRNFLALLFCLLTVMVLLVACLLLKPLFSEKNNLKEKDPQSKEAFSSAQTEEASVPSSTFPLQEEGGATVPSHGPSDPVPPSANEDQTGKEEAVTEPESPLAAETVAKHSCTEFVFTSCTTPKECKECGLAIGNAPGHNWQEATCTAPRTCKTCGEKVLGSELGHTWQEATCTMPAFCSLCKATSGEAKGHSIGMTQCTVCGHSDFSGVAGTYGGGSGFYASPYEPFEMSSFTLSSTGILSFRLGEASYSFQLLETTHDNWETRFSCYSQNGERNTDVSAKIVLDSHRIPVLHLEWNQFNGRDMYFFGTYYG